MRRRAARLLPVFRQRVLPEPRIPGRQAGGRREPTEHVQAADRPEVAAQAQVHCRLSALACRLFRYGHILPKPVKHQPLILARQRPSEACSSSYPKTQMGFFRGGNDFYVFRSPNYINHRISLDNRL